MAALKTKKRQTAHKLWIRDIINGKFVKQEGWEPSYIDFDDRQVSRVNLVATVVGKFLSEDGNYGAIVLDDGTETIRSKAFGPDVAKLKDIKIGALVRYIGKIKQYNEELYTSPEAIRELDDPNWMILHKLELGSPASGIPSPEEIKPTIPEKVAEQKIAKEAVNLQSEMLEIIKRLDEGKGAELARVIEASGLPPDDAKNIIIGLLQSGDVFEPKKEMLKVLD
jgi:hypothetical protein